MPVEQRGQVIDVRIEPTDNGRSSMSWRETAVFKRWHEPDESRGSCPLCQEDAKASCCMRDGGRSSGVAL